MFNDDFKFYNKNSNSILDKPISSKRIGSSLLGKKVHISCDLLTKHRIVDRSVPVLKSQTFYSTASDRQLTACQSRILSSKRSFMQEDRAVDGLKDIFDNMTGKHYRQVIMQTEQTKLEDSRPSKKSIIVKAGDIQQ
jgi:hypothetical protein